jgi:uncharacterized protein (TIGR03435 family)
MVMRSRWTLLATLLTLGLAPLSVTANDETTFEVASVKVSTPIPDLRLAKCQGGPGTADPERFTCNNMPLASFISMAYNVQGSQVIGPDWLPFGEYDINAKVPAGSTREQFNAMFQNLLVERFRLKERRETAAVDGFGLVVRKSGLLVKPSRDEGTADPGVTTKQGSGRIVVTARKQNFALFARYLSSSLRQPVVDQTGETGEYDFVLEFADWYVKRNVSNGETASSIVTEALEETLGLSLKAQKVTVERLFVESADKVPTAN